MIRRDLAKHSLADPAMLEVVNQPTGAADVPDPWASSVVLGSGDTAFIRPLTTADKPALREFHERQSAESIYRRYFSPKPTLTERDLEHFTNVDMVDRVALAVESQDQFVAWASYERWPGRNEAEAAFMVDDDFHGRGIATLLLEHLAAIARSNGIARFTAEVLGDNRGMLAVFSKAGWPLKRRFDSGVVDLDWDLATTEEFLDSVERREQRADSRAVARLLIPKAIAIVGASDRAGSVGAALWENLTRTATMPVHAVNPNRTHVGGIACFASIDELPDDVSLAILAVPAAAVEASIDACIAKRMRGAIIITDVDDTDVDVPALVARSRRNGLRLIGPSSMGAAALRPDSQLQAALVDVQLPAGGVAISLQSGSLGGSVLRQARELDLGLSWFVSLGDKSDISGNDLLQFWEDDDQTRVIAMYTESFGNPSKFARIARRVSRRRPIVAVRTGAAADGALGSALFQQAGLIEVPTVHALLDTARVLASQPVLRGPAVRVITNSRSPATLAAAALSGAGLEPTIERLPLESTAEALHRSIDAAIASADVDGVLVIHTPAVASNLDSATANAIDRAGTDVPKPVVAVMLGDADGPVRRGSDVPGFSFPEQAAAVLARSYAYGRWLHAEHETTPLAISALEPDAAQAIISQAFATRSDTAAFRLDVARSLAMLEAYGIAAAQAVEATPATAVEAARSLGYPVAIKAARRGVGRSVKAGIALDLAEDDDVTESVGLMSDALGADADQLIVQHMTAPGFEVRIRCTHDERLGVIVSVGLGGVHADVIDDRASRLAPVSGPSARAMLAETKVAAALTEAGIDSGPLVDAICRAALLASDQHSVADLDLNPVIVTSDSAVVTDVAITLDQHDHRDAPLRKLT